jgi:hypothetical protein
MLDLRDGYEEHFYITAPCCSGQSQSLGQTYSLHIGNRKLSHGKNQQESGSNQNLAHLSALKMETKYFSET